MGLQRDTILEPLHCETSTSFILSSTGNQPGNQQRVWNSFISIQEKHLVPPKHQKPALVPPPTGGAHKGRVETEEERRARKQREYEKHKQEEKRRLALRQSQATVLQKTSQQKGGTLTGGPARQDHGRAQGQGHGHGLVAGGTRSTGATQLIGVENRLKKQTTFMGKIKSVFTRLYPFLIVTL